MRKEIIIVLGVLGVLGILGIFVFAQNKPEQSIPVTPIISTPSIPNPSSTIREKDGCKIGGCSNQVCSDQEGIITTCEYTEAYACYHTAICERQKDGECGWTQTEELKTCLLNANGNSIKAPIVK